MCLSANTTVNPNMGRREDATYGKIAKRSNIILGSCLRHKLSSHMTLVTDNLVTSQERGPTSVTQSQPGAKAPKSRLKIRVTHGCFCPASWRAAKYRTKLEVLQLPVGHVKTPVPLSNPSSRNSCCRSKISCCSSLKKKKGITFSNQSTSDSC